MTELCRSVIGDRADGWIFLNSKGGQWTQTAFEHRLQRLCGDLGITHGATLYSFRHGWGSEAINEKGMNPALVAMQMGHTDLKQLMKTYLHADSDAMRRALDESRWLAMLKNTGRGSDRIGSSKRFSREARTSDKSCLGWVVASRGFSLLGMAFAGDYDGAFAGMSAAGWYDASESAIALTSNSGRSFAFVHRKRSATTGKRI